MPTLLVLVLLLMSTGSAAQAFDPSHFVPLAMTVLRVEAPAVNGQVKVGTAITVAPGVVVTSCHVTRETVAVRVVKGAGRWTAEGQFADPEHDLCFLSVPRWPGRPVRFAEPESLGLYQRVVAMGFTRGAEVSLSEGEITGLHVHDGGRIIQSTSSFSSGASGGALLDGEGRLVGVLTFRLRGNTDHYFSVPASWVSARLPIPEDRFLPVDQPGRRRAFWEADSCCVPYFMRVGGMKSEARWPELLRLADEWIVADPYNADAWFARGLAQARLGQAREATAALMRTVGFAPRHADGWYELGAASIVLGDGDAAGNARDVLAGLDAGRAARLSGLMRGSESASQPEPDGTPKDAVDSDASARPR
ncbi:MAG: trypsin-like peptidase domain-containing protein [Lautropia sp.]|nr:trypsin-like peptidase domain-containing protein [Lautropia sp.]